MLRVHAGERETSNLLAIPPDLAKMEHGSDGDGSDQQRFTRAGAAAEAEEVKVSVQHSIEALVKVVKEAKDDYVTQSPEREL